MDNKFELGDIVKALAGKEKNNNYIIIKLDNLTASIVNGKNRNLENSKIKNLKHLMFLKRNTDLKNLILENKLVDANVIKILKDYMGKKLI